MVERDSAGIDPAGSRFAVWPAGLSARDCGRSERENAPVSTSPTLGHATDTLFRAVAAVADALYVVDADGRTAYLNPAAVSILGYGDESELLGKRSHETIHYVRPDGSHFPAEECPLLQPLLTGETVRIDQDFFVRKDGSLVAVAYSSAPVELEGGRGAVVVFHDITDRLRLGEVEASRARIARAAYAARRSIVRDLHDGAQQQFVSVALQLENVRGVIEDQPAEAARLVAAAQEGLRDAIEELRRLANGIHPVELSERGLAPALRMLAARSGADVEVSGEEIGRLAPEIESAAYFIAAEATANAVKHARANRIQVIAARTTDGLRLTVEDDGVGGASFSDGTGLQGLRDRAEAIGGRLTASSPTGGPTVVATELPLLRPRRNTGVGAHLRVVLADDAAMIRQAFGELLARAGLEVVAQSATRNRSCATSRSTNRTSRSSTSTCRRHRPTRASTPRWRSVDDSHTSESFSSRATSRWRRQSTSSRRPHTASATSSRNRSPTSTT
jgi:PAS domain S-box-containing protein